MISAPRGTPGGPIGTESLSRAATDGLLRGLRDEGWSTAAWVRFLGRAARRSVREAIRRPAALAQATALHAAFALAAPASGRRWVAVSWGLAVTHLGMLEERRTLGPANILTLVRANLPALGDRLGALLPVMALATDFVDGRISRASGSQTAFGRDADFIADAAVWNWHAARYEPSLLLRLGAVAVWAARSPWWPPRASPGAP